MLAKGPDKGKEDDWNTKIQGALFSGIESGSIDAATRQAAMSELGMAGGGKAERIRGAQGLEKLMRDLQARKLQQIR